MRVMCARSVDILQLRATKPTDDKTIYQRPKTKFNENVRKIPNQKTKTKTNAYITTKTKHI